MDGKEVLGVSKSSILNDSSNPYLARRTEMQEVYQPREKSDHQLRVEDFMRKAGQEVPDKPTIPSEEVRLLRAKLILEEAVETIHALGFDIEGDIDPDYNLTDMIIPHTLGCDIKEVIDGCCDIAVVTTGTLSAFGIADVIPQKEVDHSNLAKFTNTTCPKCKEQLQIFAEGTKNPLWTCLNSSCDYHAPAEQLGGYRREDGKWIKPVNWQPPNWDRILKEQGHTSDNVIVVDESKIPIGPGDGIRKRNVDGEYHYTAYQGHLCPNCKAPISDEAVKRMCTGVFKSFRCAECSVPMTASTESWERPELYIYKLP